MPLSGRLDRQSLSHFPLLCPAFTLAVVCVTEVFSPGTQEGLWKSLDSLECRSWVR